MYIPAEKHGKPVAPSSFVQTLRETVHLDELKKDRIIRHKNLGKGRILQIMENGIIEVQFNNGQKRKIDSIYCINNDIITWEDEDNEKK